MDRVLIVGQGSSGKRHLKLAKELLPNSEIKVFRSTRNSESTEINTQILITKEEVIAFKPTIAILANPSPLHIEFASLLASIGTHMLIEKPLSHSSVGVSEFLSLCKERSIVVSLGYNLRFLPSLLEFKSYLDQNLVGQVLSVRSVAGQYLPNWRPMMDYRESVSAQRILGGGVLLELSHELDYLIWIFGEIEWVSATVSKQSNLEIDVEDLAQLNMGIKGRTNGSQIFCSLVLDFIRRDQTRQCYAIGEIGTLRWDGISGKVDVYKDSLSGWETLFSDVSNVDMTYRAEWENFLQSVLDNKAPRVGSIDGLAVIKVVEAAKLSSASSKEVIVNYQTKVQEEKR